MTPLCIRSIVYRIKREQNKRERNKNGCRHQLVIYTVTAGLTSGRSPYIKKPTEIQGPVVESSISANPGLKFKLLFWFVFCMSIYFKSLENKTSIDPDKISRKKHL